MPSSMMPANTAPQLCVATHLAVSHLGEAGAVHRTLKKVAKTPENLQAASSPLTAQVHAAAVILKARTLHVSPNLLQCSQSQRIISILW
eukprot:6440-Heterococcus_DN1.PRE.2